MRRALAVLAAILLPAMAVAGPASANASNVQVINLHSALAMTDNGNNQRVTLVTSTGETFSAVDNQTWKGLAVNEWKDSSGRCLRTASNGFLYTNTCASGFTDHAEFFFVPFTTTPPTAGEVWFISVYWTDTAGQNEFLTEVNGRPGSQVEVLPAGQGDAAVWYCHSGGGSCH